MSATYTLHLPEDAEPGRPEALDRAVLVRDGFSWGAFLVPALWFARHRHWLLALGVIVVVVALAAVLRLLGARWGTVIAAELLLHALLGWEGTSLRRWSYARRGRPAMDVVYAANEAEAEAKSFARWLAPPALPTPKPPPLPARVRAWAGRDPHAVIGLFPDAEGRR